MKQLKPILMIVGAVLLLTASTVVFAKKFKVGFSQCNFGEPWRAQMNLEMQQAAAKVPDMELIMKDAQNDTLKQRAQIEELVAMGVDVLIVSPKEAVPLTQPVAKAYAKGIPVIVVDRRIVGDQYTAFIGADNKKIGEAAGRWIAKKMGGSGHLVELKGLMTSTPGQDRHTGFRKGISDAQFKIVFEADMKWFEANARKEMESALAVHKKIDLVYSHNDPGAHGAYLAARAAGRDREMLFVGIDGLPHEGKAYVAKGILAASFEYPTGGTAAVEAAAKLVRGEKLPKEITLRTRVYTRDNVAKGGDWLE